MRLSELMTIIESDQYLYINYPPNRRYSGPAWYKDTLEFLRYYNDYVVLSIWGDETEDGAVLSIDIVAPIEHTDKKGDRDDPHRTI